MAKKYRMDGREVFERKPRRTRRHRPTGPINLRHKKARKPQENR